LFLKRSFVVYVHQKKPIMNNNQIIHHHASKLQVQLNYFFIHLRSVSLSFHPN
jgi:hypothetical protein